MSQERKQVTLVGSGLTGPLLAISLVKRGFAVQLYERRPDMRRVRISAGRSINLALSTRGIHALREAGLWEVSRTDHHPDARAHDALGRRRAHVHAIRQG